VDESFAHGMDLVSAHLLETLRMRLVLTPFMLSQSLSRVMNTQFKQRRNKSHQEAENQILAKSTMHQTKRCLLLEGMGFSPST